jgi:hypothetical protein
MRIVSRVTLGLATFLATAGLIYQVTSRERAGGSLMLGAAVGFAYIGLVLRAAGRAAEGGDSGEEGGPAELDHVGPTIWPFGFSLAAVALVVGVVIEQKVLIAVGIALFVGSSLGWFVDVRRQRSHAKRS